MSDPYQKNPPQNNTKTPIKLVDGRVVTAVQILPAKFVAKELFSPAEKPADGFVRWTRDEKTGAYFPIIMSVEPYVRLTDDTPKQLGLGIDYKSLYRLCRGGFIECRRPTPYVTEINLPSLYAFLEAVEDQHFWTPERIIRLRETSWDSLGKDFRRTRRLREQRQKREAQEKKAKADAEINKNLGEQIFLPL